MSDSESDERISKYMIVAGALLMVIPLLAESVLIDVAFFTGNVYLLTLLTPVLGGFFLFGLIFGSILIFAGILVRISWNTGEGDSLWVMKMGPFGKRT